MVPGEVAGVALIDGAQVELIDPYWLFAAFADAGPVKEKPLVCACRRAIRRMDNMLRPLIEGLGYEVVAAGEGVAADILIASAEDEAESGVPASACWLRSGPRRCRRERQQHLPLRPRRPARRAQPHCVRGGRKTDERPQEWLTSCSSSGSPVAASPCRPPRSKAWSSSRGSPRRRARRPCRRPVGPAQPGADRRRRHRLARFGRARPVDGLLDAIVDPLGRPSYALIVDWSRT